MLQTISPLCNIALEKVIFNPGVIPPASYRNISAPNAYWCPFEQTYKKLEDTMKEVAEFAQDNNSVILVHSAPDGWNLQTVKDTVRNYEQKNIPGFNITSDTLDKAQDQYPWNQLTNYSEDLVQVIKYR